MQYPFPLRAWRLCVNVFNRLQSWKILDLIVFNKEFQEFGGSSADPTRRLQNHQTLHPWSR